MDSEGEGKMNQVAEYLGGFTKIKIMLSSASSSSNNNKNNKERKSTSALAYVSIRQQYFSIPTSAFDTEPSFFSL